MGKLNTIAIIILLLVSGFAGYKIGDFSLADIYEEKLMEEIAKTNEALKIAHEAHKEEMARINLEHRQQILATDEKYKEETNRLNEIITNKDRDIENLGKTIEKKSEEILAELKDVALLTSELEELKAKARQQVALSSAEQQRLTTLTSKLSQKDQQIVKLRQDIVIANQEKQGRECLDIPVPTSKGNIL